MSRRILILIITGILLAAAVGLAATYRLGDRGSVILKLQDNLALLGFFHGPFTGYYGPLTEDAVKLFQEAHGLKADGVAGPQTLTAIREALERKSAELSSRNGDGTVVLLQWDIVDKLWKSGTNARVYDVDTGSTFIVRRLYGTFHADVEPLTKQDTSILFRIYGYKWSWTPRSIIVELGGRYIAASMNGMPHGHQAIRDNNFPGQNCIHFLGSRHHNSRQVDPKHQAMVMKAARSGLPTPIQPTTERIEEIPPESQAEPNPSEAPTEATDSSLE